MSIALKMIIFFTFLTGIIYPVIITGISQVFFNDKANGQIILKDGKPIGSRLIGQKFKSAKYFISRPSSVEYDSSSSGATNLSPISKELRSDIQSRKSLYKSHDLLTSSSSGLDPHISPEAALEQVEKVSRARNLSDEQKVSLERMITNMTESRTLGFMGEPRVNVLELNLALENL